MKFAISPKKTSSIKSTPEPPQDAAEDSISPELVPIVTLLSAQTHRRYHEGIFMLYNDLNGDGNPADRKWKEVYGILTGNQLAYWDATSLAKFKNSPEQLLEASSKPTYLNFTDAVFNAMKVLPAAKQQLENVIVVSTTLKNRLIIQLKSYDSLKEWFVALRLATFEYSSLQEAYTGALLSARGSQLSDIRTILAEKRFAHSDWVKIRYGSGMAWRRCYAVIEPSQTKRKTFTPGKVLLYDSENLKKKSLLGVISSATSVTAVYPQSPFFIDKSTIMKLEGCINFKSSTKKSSADSQETSLFLMPEQHSSVPGFDTLIRFLVPLFDSFGLYGRPKRLKADRVDPESLVFGLPTLPHVHYLNSSDLYVLTGSDVCLSWDAATWRENIKRVLRSKLAQGYDGCGSSRGFLGAVSSLNSPSLGSPSSSRVSSRSSPQHSAHPGYSGGQSRNASAVNGKLGQGPGQGAGQGQGHRQGQGQGQGQLSQGHGQLSQGHGQSTQGNGQSRQQREGGNHWQTGPHVAEDGVGIGAGSVPRLHPDASASTVSDTSLSFGLKEKQHGLNKNVNNLQIETPGVERKSVQLADIYHKYSTIEAPSDRFNDRNKILNGSAEEIDEEHLPSLMRKKSLKNGPYPMSDQHLIDSDESDAQSEASFSELEDDLLAVPPINENRNSSYSSVKSPLTQYNEFSKQFSKAVDQYPVHDRYGPKSGFSSDDDIDMPPIPPAHETPYKQKGQVPIIQQTVSVPMVKQNSQKHSPTQHHSQHHMPSQGTEFNTEDYSHNRPRNGPSFSEVSRQSNQNPEAKPRYIQAPVSQARSEQAAPSRPPQRSQQPVQQPQNPQQSQRHNLQQYQQSQGYQKIQQRNPQTYGGAADQLRDSNAPAQHPKYHPEPSQGQSQYAPSQNYQNVPQQRVPPQKQAQESYQSQQYHSQKQQQYQTQPQQQHQAQKQQQYQAQKQQQYQAQPQQQYQAQPQQQYQAQPQQQYQAQPQQQYQAQPQQQYQSQKQQQYKTQPQQQYQSQPQQPQLSPNQYQSQPHHHQYQQAQHKSHQKRPPPSNNGPNGSLGNGSNPAAAPRHPYQARAATGSSPYNAPIPQGAQISSGLQANSQPGMQNLRSYGDSNQYGYQANPSHPVHLPKTDPRYQNPSGYARQY